MSAATLYAELKDAVQVDDLERARDRALAIISACDSDTPTAIDLRGDGLFDALCVEMSIGAMENANVNVLRRHFDTCVKDDFKNALQKYVEGTARLRTSTAIARQRFSEALSCDNCFVLARLGIAVTLYQEGEWKPCFSELKHVVASLGDLTPNIVRVLLGVCAFQLREFTHARKCLDRALEVDPADPMALLTSFALHAHFREALQAAKVIERLEEVAPTTNVQQKRTDMLFYGHLARQQLDAEAPKLLARIEHTLKAASDSGDTRLEAYAHFQAGRLFHAQGQQAAARDRYTKAMQSDPALRAARVHFAELERHGAGRAACEAAVSRGFELDDKDPRLLEMATLLSSESASHSRAIGFAKLLVESAAKAQPESWTTAAWANRLDKEEFLRLSDVASKLRQHLGVVRDGATAANAAVLAHDQSALLAAAKAQGVNLEANPSTVQQLDPAAVPFWFNFALLRESDSTQQARAIYVMLVKTAPTEPASYSRLVLLAVQAKRPTEALRWAKLFRTANPNDSTAAVLTAWILKSQGMLSESLAVIRRAASSGADESLAICTGSLYLADAVDSTRSDRKLSMALNGFAYALEKDRHNVLAAHGAACCLASQGKHMHVAGLLERVAEMDCNVPEMKDRIVGHRFNVLVETRAYRNAIATLEGESDLTRAQQCSLAVCYSAIGEYTKAVTTLHKALESQPKDATLCFYLTFTLLQAVFDVITRKSPVTQADGEEAHRRLTQAIEVAKYAVGVKAEDQRTAIKQVVAFVGKGSITRAIDRRVADFTRERADAHATEAAWRQAASQLETQKEELIKVQREKEEEIARARREASQTTFLYQQQKISEWTSGMPIMPEESGAAGPHEAVEAVDDAREGSKRPREGGLEATFEALGAEVGQPAPSQPRPEAEATLAVGLTSDE